MLYTKQKLKYCKHVVIFIAFRSSFEAISKLNFSPSWGVEESSP